MKNLISSEIYKWMKSKSFKVCTIVGCGLAIFSVAMFLLLSIMMDMVNESIAEDMGEDYAAEQELMNEEMIAEYKAMGMSDSEIAMITGIYDGEMMLSMSFSQTDLQLLIAIFIAIFVAGEFNNGTIKMIVSRGYSRTQIYWSKFISGIIASNIMALVMVLVTTILGCIIWGWNDPVTGAAAGALDVLKFLLVQFALNTAITAMFIGCSMMFRSLGISIAITIVSYTFGSVIFVLLDAVIQGLCSVIEYNVDKLPFLPSEVWIMQTVVNTSTLDISNHDLTIGLAVSLVYTALFTFIGMWTFKKNDIK